MLCSDLPQRIYESLKTLCCLASATGPLRAHEIAAADDLPPAQTAKILQLMTWAGFVKSRRGTKGGFWLARQASSIRVTDVTDFFARQGKAGRSHEQDGLLKALASATARCQAMASSHFNDAQATAILAFLTYDEAHRKSLNKPTVPSAPSGIVDAGRQFYKEQGCDSCHVIGGEGGSGGPSLSDVGKRLSRERISNIIRGLRSGQPGSGMPPLPSETTDQQVHDLIEFLRLAET